MDFTGEPLGGAEFLLEWSVDGKAWQPVSYTDSDYVAQGGCNSENLTDGKLISEETGLVEFTGLHPERLYRLTETAAPEGYQLLPDIGYEGGRAADEHLVVQLTVVNVPVFELPKTGSEAMLLMQITMIGTYALSALLVEAAKRRDK